jgi:chromosome segregation ATPase
MLAISFGRPYGEGDNPFPGAPCTAVPWAIRLDGRGMPPMNLKEAIRIILKLPQKATRHGLLVLLLLTSACTTTGQVTQPDANNRILAENSQMKKRLPSIERENDVLNQENLEYKKRLRQTEAKIEKLSADLTTLNEKYAMDMAQSEEQIGNLHERYNLLQGESTRKFAELMELYNALEQKRNQDVKALNNQIAEQKNTFSLERDALKQQSAKREFELLGEIADLKKDLDSREMEIASLKTANSDISQQMNKLSAKLEASQATREQVEQELIAAKEANAKLLQKIQRLSGGSAIREPKP